MDNVAFITTHVYMIHFLDAIRIIYVLPQGEIPTTCTIQILLGNKEIPRGGLAHSSPNEVSCANNLFSA